jgi:Ca2+-binding EF-hand superfamily protein
MDNLPTLYAHSVQADQLKAAFLIFDTNGDGYIRWGVMLSY